MLYALTQEGLEFNRGTLLCTIFLATLAIVIIVRGNRED